MAVPHFVFLLLVVAGTGALGQGEGNTCQLNCTNSSPGDKIPDPRDCRKFYVCLATDGPSDVPFYCPDGLKFDTVTRECVSEGATCALCYPKCKYDCVIPSGYAAVREDCTKITFCEIDPPFTVQCGPGEEYFDGESCQSDAAQCCDPCLVFCQEGNIETADPTSCRHFYFCTHTGYPLPQDRYECPEGELFDSTMSMCVDESLATCIQPCAATTTTSTTATPTTTTTATTPTTTTTATTTTSGSTTTTISSP
ncbi:integumentary mucin C.1-like [Portunus trituberculatus]|uniref:integumentary mucin C.1-like n=1 Tax=Portunus trituberculatus TaxID=210409 RepID=UPI001E1CBBE5|nr:integumentary mucin C.1-like [Portunus trituberculatus]